MTLNRSEIYQITWLHRNRKRGANAAENLGFYALRSKNFGLEKAIRLNPRGPNLWSVQWPLGQCHLLLGQVDKAIDLFRKACAASPQAYFLHLNLSGALGLRGDLNEARAAMAEAIRIKPEVNTLARYRASTPWITNPKHWALRDKTLNVGLRRAGFPDE